MGEEGCVCEWYRTLLFHSSVLQPLTVFLYSVSTLNLVFDYSVSTLCLLFVYSLTTPCLLLVYSVSTLFNRTLSLLSLSFFLQTSPLTVHYSNNKPFAMFSTVNRELEVRTLQFPFLSFLIILTSYLIFLFPSYLSLFMAVTSVYAEAIIFHFW